MIIAYQSMPSLLPHAPTMVLDLHLFQLEAKPYGDKTMATG